MKHLTPWWFFAAILLGSALLSLTGCVNPYEKFYTNSLTPDRVRYCLPHTGETQYYGASTPDMKQDVQAILRQGYVAIGYASFEANSSDYTSALHQKAKEVQADIVLMSSSFARTQSGVMPLMTYHPGQTSTTYNNGQVNASAYGSGGYAYGSANYSGTSTTTSPGTLETNYVPYSVTRNTYNAVFFRRYHYLIGARWRPLNDGERAALERNTGLYVEMVIEDTPAYVANILPGDILLTFNGEAIASSEWLNERSREMEGQIVKFGIRRHGAEKVIELRMRLFR